MRGRPNPQRSMLAIVDPGNGSPKTIRCDGSRPSPTRPWNGSLRSLTACMPVWGGPLCRPNCC